MSLLSLKAAIDALAWLIRGRWATLGGMRGIGIFREAVEFPSAPLSAKRMSDPVQALLEDSSFLLILEVIGQIRYLPNVEYAYIFHRRAISWSVFPDFLMRTS